MKEVLLYLWQLPQNLIGYFLTKIYREGINITSPELSGKYWYCPAFHGGISLGKYVIIGNLTANTLLHEHGHQLQSRKLGWLYLIVIGLPSLLWAVIYSKILKKSGIGYYKFYTEKWADRLGGVLRG